MHEIDLLISRGGKLHPVEIKLSANPGAGSMRHFGVIGEMGFESGTGCVISLTRNIVPVKGSGNIINAASLWLDCDPQDGGEIS